MMKKGKKSGGWTGIAAPRLQHSWKSVFVVVVFLVLATTTLMIDQVFQAARIHSVHLVKSLPTAASRIIPKRIVEDIPKLETDTSVLRSKVEPLVSDPLVSDVLSKVDPLVSDPLVSDVLSKLEPRNSGLTLVRDIVAFPEEVMLLVEAAKGSSASVAPSKDDLVCLFGKQHKTGVFTIDWQDDIHSVLAVRCEHPPGQVLLESNRKATLLFKETNFAVPSSVEYTTNSSWTPLVYETVTDPDSVILFVKGLLDSKGRPGNYSRILDKLHCRFGNDVKSRVKVIAQEVVRCALPTADAMMQLKGARVSLFVPQMGLLPSVAYFSTPPPPPRPLASSGGRPFHICACTMIWNQAPFLREWITYHGFLGIERWYLYDNNSDDDIEEVLGGLQPTYNVTRHPWPWIKTQEAGFSHCTLRARADCEWVLFADVDEFVYPTKDLLELVYGNSSSESNKLPKSWVERKSPVNWTQVAETASAPNRPSVLWGLIQRTLKNGEAIGKNVGEVRLVCHNFGPSGLSRAPQDGVMVGYTCRMQWPQRHKSFIYLDAMSESLLNVVHHFALKDEYKEMAVHARIAVINHYKFQAWEVFKAKFVRRVATYVVDWREQTALSNDRAPGLGLEAVEPEDWPTRYCEEVDWGLKNFTENAFRHPTTKLMVWQSL